MIISEPSNYYGKKKDKVIKIKTTTNLLRLLKRKKNIAETTAIQIMCVTNVVKSTTS